MNIGDTVSWSEGDYEFRGRVKSLRSKPGPRKEDAPTVFSLVVDVKSRRRGGRNWYRTPDTEKNVKHIDILCVADPASSNMRIAESNSPVQKEPRE